MGQFVHRWILTCEMCQKRKGPSQKAKGKMQEYLVGAPNEWVAMDILGLFSVTESDNKWLLVIYSQNVLFQCHCQMCRQLLLQRL